MSTAWRNVRQDGGRVSFGTSPWGGSGLVVVLLLGGLLLPGRLSEPFGGVVMAFGAVVMVPLVVAGLLHRYTVTLDRRGGRWTFVRGFLPAPRRWTGSADGMRLELTASVFRRNPRWTVHLILGPDAPPVVVATATDEDEAFRDLAEWRERTGAEVVDRTVRTPRAQVARPVPSSPGRLRVEEAGRDGARITWTGRPRTSTTVFLGAAALLSLANCASLLHDVLRGDLVGVDGAWVFPALFLGVGFTLFGGMVVMRSVRTSVVLGKRTLTVSTTAGPFQRSSGEIRLSQALDVAAVETLGPWFTWRKPTEASGEIRVRMADRSIRFGRDLTSSERSWLLERVRDAADGSQASSDSA